VVVPTGNRDLYRGIHRFGFVVGQGRGEYRVPISIWPEIGNDAALMFIIVAAPFLSLYPARPEHHRSRNPVLPIRPPKPAHREPEHDRPPHRPA
jgi:hypothetical protein